MRSCGSILIGGAVVLGIGLVASGNGQSGNFVTALVVMAVIGFVIVSAGKKDARKAVSTGQRLPAQDQGSIAGWTLVKRADEVAREWNANHPTLPSTGIFQVRRGRAHRRQVTVFQAAPEPPSRTFMIFRMPDYSGPPFEAISDGRSEISVRGQVSEGLSAMLTAIGPRTFHRLGILPGKLFWLDAGTMTESQVSSFVLTMVPGIVQAANAHLPTDGSVQRASQTGAQQKKAGQTKSTQTRSNQPQSKQPQSKQPQSKQRRPEPARRPATQLRPTAPASALPHHLGPNPDDILRTGPIEITERPALQPAKADPIAASLDNPELSAPWKPVEWTPAPFALTAPMGLGETPSSAQELAGGWKPRPWTPPTYGHDGSDEWKPAASWQPNYTTTGDD